MTRPLTMQSFIAPAGAPALLPVSHAQGIYIWDSSGRRFIDGSSGAVCSTVGHANPRVMAAAREQLDKVSFAYARAWESTADTGLVERLARWSGFGLDSAFFVSGGSEAVEASLKFARQVAVSRGQTGRWKVVSRMPSYHGSTLGALSVTGDDVFGGVFRPMMAAHPKIPAPLTYRVPQGHDVDSYGRFCAEALETTILQERADTILAFIMEPVGGTATGALVAPDAYHAMVREICDRHGVLLIYDEVMSCVGRAGKFLAAQYWPQARPDIVALAKGLGGGYTPLGALLTSAALVDEVRAAGGFAHGHTYAANPMSCAIGCAVVDEVIERDLIGNSARMGRVLRESLESLKATCPLVGDVRGRGLQLAVEIVADQVSKRPLPPESRGVERLREWCIEHGLVLLTRRTSGGRFGEWLMIGPPLIVTEPQIEEVVNAFARGLRSFQEELTRAGLVRLG